MQCFTQDILMLSVCVCVLRKKKAYMNKLTHINPLYHCKATEVKDTDEQGCIAFSKTKINHKNEV